MSRSHHNRSCADFLRGRRGFPSVRMLPSTRWAGAAYSKMLCNRAERRSARRITDALVSGYHDDLQYQQDTRDEIDYEAWLDELTEDAMEYPAITAMRRIVNWNIPGVHDKAAMPAHPAHQFHNARESGLTYIGTHYGHDVFIDLCVSRTTYGYMYVTWGPDDHEYYSAVGYSITCTNKPEMKTISSYIGAAFAALVHHPELCRIVLEAH